MMPMVPNVEKIQQISCISIIFPIFGIFGMIFIAKESPVTIARKKLAEENDSLLSDEMIQRLKVPIKSQSVYKPLSIIMVLILIQQSSGFIYIKRYLLQIIDCEGMDNRTLHLMAFIILLARFIVVSLMSFLLLKIRVRLLYFSSLVMTMLTLLVMGLLTNGSIPISSNYCIISKVGLICLHVLFIQIGINTLPGLLIDILFPTSCRPILKGCTRAFSSVSLIFLFILFQAFGSFDLAFFFMATILLITTPIVYVWIPETRNIGTKMAAEFFMPVQTIYYYLLPKDEDSNQNA